MGGQALSPPLSNQYFVFHIIAKGILQSHFFFISITLVNSFGYQKRILMQFWRSYSKSKNAMRRCLARLYYFIRIGNRVRIFKNDIINA